MTPGRLLDAASGRVLIARVDRADTALERLRGLLGRSPLGGDDALLLTRCASVHTCGMRYTLDLVYVDRRWRVLKVVRSLAPWRISGCLRASMTLELPGGAAAVCGIARGQTLAWDARN